LWAVKKANVYGLLKDVPLYRFHYACANFKRVSAWLDVDLRVQGKKFKGVMVPRETGWRAWTSITGPARADLIGSVLQLSARRDTFRQPRRRARNIPDKPMKLVVGPVVATNVHIMHVQKEGTVPGGVLIHVISGEVWLPAWVYFNGMSEPSAKPVMVMIRCF
jgi:hypothetical protein